MLQFRRVLGVLHRPLINSHNRWSSQSAASTSRPDITDEVVHKVNESVSEQGHGRLFAVVHVDGRQFKITDHDLIALKGERPLDVGDQIRLEKVLMVGSKNFSIFGRPLIPAEHVRVTATVIEQTLSHTEPDFRMVPRKKIRILKFLRDQLCVLRINQIELLEPLPTTA